MQKRIAFRERKELQKLCAWATFYGENELYDSYEAVQQEVSKLKQRIMRIENVGNISVTDYKDELARHYGCLEIKN